MIYIMSKKNTTKTAADGWKLLTKISLEDEFNLQKTVNKIKKTYKDSHLSTESELKERYNIPDSEFNKVITQSGLSCNGGLYSYAPLSAGSIPIRCNLGSWLTIGLVSDTHLGSIFAREDALSDIYKVFKREGVSQVFHAGNIVEGFISRINADSVYTPSLDGQVAYCIEKYPKVEGITTYFITGDDHEGWWQKSGFNFGKYLQEEAKLSGRNDLKYLGHVEADVQLRNKHGSCIMKIQHPGGGSAYSRSYAAQKQVEALQGGEKPAILVQGHYHVSNFMNDRNVYIVNMPGFQDQTIFARKKRLRMEIGGAIARIMLSPLDGSVSRFAIEFIMYFDRGYYKKFLKSDETTKPHTILV
jgi:predicted phosphodiesterase